VRRCGFERFAAGSAPDGLEKVQRGTGGVMWLLGHRHVTALRKHNCPCVRHQRFVEASLAAARWADVVMVLIPDELQGDVYHEDLAACMKQGAALMFAHGLNVHFNLIEPRSDLDVLMVAPKGPGRTVRSEYERGAGVPCLLAFARDMSGNAHDIGLSYAAAIGGGRAGIIGNHVSRRVRNRSIWRTGGALRWSG
jgi:Acetohydroxy acid isomeroreductase, NADPH-binding domain